MDYRKGVRIFCVLVLILLSVAAILAAVSGWQRQQEKLRQHIAENGQQEAPTEGEPDETEALGSTAHAKDVQPQAFAGEDPQVLSENEDKFQKTASVVEPYRFELREQNGYLEVYRYHTDQLFLQTGISCDILSKDQKQELAQGKFFQNEQELYGYLESCTS